MMLKIITKIKLLLTIEERKSFLYLILAMVISAIVEIIGVGSIMPFMSTITNPEIINENIYINYIYTQLSFSSVNSFLIFFGFAVLVILVINNVWAATVNWLIFRYTWMRNHSISKRLLEKYIYQPYEFFINRNTAELKKNIVEEVYLVVVGILIPLLMIIKSVFSTIFIVSLLFFNDPVLAGIITMTLGLAYLILFKMVSNTLGRIGRERADSNRERYKMVNEMLCGIKEIKILCREDFFIDNFSKSSFRLSNSQALKNTISLLPKYAIEVIAFGGIVIILLYFLVTKKDTSEIVPLMALYAFAGYRLMPALQTIFTGFSQIKYTTPALDIISHDFALSKTEIIYKENHHDVSIKLDNVFSINNLMFTYSGQDTPVFTGLNIKIPANCSAGFIGSTGSGKTTLINIILGLLEPNFGEIKIDGVTLTNFNLASWQKTIGYVPQDIFLIDATISENIAFGFGSNDINIEDVINSAKLANIHDFIVSDLPNGYETVVGERGIRLSGGQKQRVGIARALCHNPRILILDEATSSLDNITEKEVMQAIINLKGKKTIIMIAHRLSTLEHCDTIYVLEKGKLVNQGTYDFLSENSPHFKQMTLRDDNT